VDIMTAAAFKTRSHACILNGLLLYNVLIMNAVGYDLLTGI
jgi:hypothetical protein